MYSKFANFFENIMTVKFWKFYTVLLDCVKIEFFLWEIKVDNTEWYHICLQLQLFVYHYSEWRWEKNQNLLQTFSSNHIPRFGQWHPKRAKYFRGSGQRYWPNQNIPWNWQPFPCTIDEVHRCLTCNWSWPDQTQHKSVGANY